MEGWLFAETREVGGSANRIAWRGKISSAGHGGAYCEGRQRAARSRFYGEDQWGQLTWLSTPPFSSCTTS